MNEAETFVTPRFDRYPQIRGGDLQSEQYLLIFPPYPLRRADAAALAAVYSRTVHIRICMHNTSTSYARSKYAHYDPYYARTHTLEYIICIVCKVSWYPKYYY